MPEKKIVVDLSERKRHLYDGNTLMKTYPIGIGKILTKSPIGDYMIVNKEPNPKGPYGDYWMGLSKEHYGIHGTDRPSSIGKKVSKGCIRMYNKDVVELANLVPLGTHVRIQS